MNKKHLTKTMALLLACGFTLGATACDGFRVTDSWKDLEQVVARVDISTTLATDDEYSAYSDDISSYINDEEVPLLAANVYKRDLVAAFLSTGYSWLQQGLSYEQVFTSLMTQLTNSKILTQYAVAYFMKKADTVDGEKTFTEFKQYEEGAASEEVRALLKEYPEVLLMKYYLTNFGSTDDESMRAYHEAVYSLKYSLNATIDSNESSLIEADDSSASTETPRTMPTNVKVQKEDYLPMLNGALNYEVYTGINHFATECGDYEKQPGSTTVTRKQAYKSFLSSLRSYGLIKESENVANVELLNYYYLELSASLSKALVQKYYDELQETAVSKLTENNGELVKAKYAELLQGQEDLYFNQPTAFEAALDAVAEDSYLLYGLPNYGFVYNILIPFSTEQSQAYKAVQSKGVTLNEQYQARKTLLSNIVAEDLRGSWFSEDDTANYAYTPAKNASVFGVKADRDTYLFFEDNASNTDKYEKLTHYAGSYAYQGTWENGKATPDKTMHIDDFIKEMEDYINFNLGKTGENKAAKKFDETVWKSNYNTASYTNEFDKVTDYSNFMYYAGKVSFDSYDAADYFNEDSQAYKALAAVNELMFAYSTDPGCLNSYMGYAVSAYKTSFVNEFEYASQWVVERGVGTYAVVPSDYGWHIIYCSYKFEGGAVYGNDFVTTNMEVENGSFYNLFYESLKDTSATNHANAVQSAVLSKYKDSVTLFTERYQDLLDLQ